MKRIKDALNTRYDGEQEENIVTRKQLHVFMLKKVNQVKQRERDCVQSFMNKWHVGLCW